MKVRLVNRNVALKKLERKDKIKGVFIPDIARADEDTPIYEVAAVSQLSSDYGHIQPGVKIFLTRNDLNVEGFYQQDLQDYIIIHEDNILAVVE